MPDFIFRANIAHFANLLVNETDPKKISVIRKLLADEKAKLADFHASRRRSDAAE
jgi:hypothetical protein